MDKNIKNIIGKTIKSINQSSINCWVIYFTDGTEKWIWAEADGPLNIGQLWVSDDNK